MSTPRLEINLKKISHNLKTLIAFYGAKDISISAVTKVVCGNVAIAQLLVEGGITILADSRIDNLKKMSAAGLRCQFLLLGPPMLSETEMIVKHADISLNSEILVIRKLSESALEQGSIHKIILMVEYGDLREGIMPDDLENITDQVLQLKGIELIGIGTNLACFGGVHPDQEKMGLLSDLATGIEKKFNVHLQLISGGNSANYRWLTNINDSGRVNNLRIGESIFLGCETLKRERIPGLFTDAFTLVSEVTELKSKPSMPYGEMGQNAFGEITEFDDNGVGARAILGMGRQDVLCSGLSPEMKITILGGSSDHMIINPRQSGLKVGSEVRFNLNYAALLSAMTSPYVTKVNT
ncbi:alanine/ornithine racemase family PLP-dependent enzyme [Fulvivirga sp. M361]|uniref:alanine/ornithine racemase family PLP-dependent enzyme n=1 Tax=Fulvivirga sp. M361 TaxID=2594266 RepID=UPI00117B9FD1|nr:alanine/ornithine racemase family PLP-dependent enzyme [Fulvivirga sp. M361]TRX46408.1 alanine/ornithine racemase family PLP-dependent enzyme [Fulvivirga sp. M361]